MDGEVHLLEGKVVGVKGQALLESELSWLVSSQGFLRYAVLMRLVQNDGHVLGMRPRVH